MDKKDQNQKKPFEVIKEGFARARFSGALSGCAPPPQHGPISFAALENNGGLNPEEFYATQSRLLSMAVTPYRKFDFTREGVLKAAVPLFEGLTLYANHWPDVNNWKGLVQEAAWDDRNNPPGINAMLVIDKTIDPKLARGVEIKALRSVSVTIWFDYERSHPDLAGFWDRLGEEVDGEMVRLIVTRITQAGEVSIVWEGEDPFAKTFEAGAPDDAPAHTTVEEEAAMKLTAATMALLGIAVGTEITEEMLEGKIGEMGSKISDLETKVGELEPEAKLGKQLLTETRERAATLYKALKGEKTVEAFVTGVIEKADLATARALCQEYEAEADKNIPLACPKCGEKLTRRSSLETETPSAASGKRAEDFKIQ
jgi:hypothetical protein